MSKKRSRQAKSKAKKQPTTPKPLPIAADATIYGTYARLSALADYLEVCALKKVRLRKQQLADIISDNRWQLRELMVNPADIVDIEDLEDDLPAALDVAEDAADRVFSTIKERAEILGARYPFKIDGEQVVLKPGFRIRDSPYVAMLAIIVAHSFKLSGDPAPTQVLEDVVGDVLKKKIRLGINFGQLRRKTSPFLAAVAEACPLMKITYAVPDVLISSRAQDENVDTIAHVHWDDRRPGTWCFIGQVTCAISDEWEKKLDEPKPATWASLLHVTPKPMVFLAVPHHVETSYMEKLLQSERGIVIDRLRLVMNLNGVDGPKRKLVRKMLNAKMDAF